MSLKLQIFIGIIVVIMLGLIVNMVRKKKDRSKVCIKLDRVRDYYSAI